MTTHKSSAAAGAGAKSEEHAKPVTPKATRGSTAEVAASEPVSAASQEPTLTKSSEIAAPGTSQAQVDARDKQREEVHKARLENAEKTRAAAADEHSKAIKERVQAREARVTEDKVEPVVVSNPTPTTQMLGLHGVTYYVKPGKSELYPAPGATTDQLRTLLRRLQVFGVTVEEGRKQEPKDNFSKSKIASTSDDSYEPTEDEIQALINTPEEMTVVDQPTRKPSNNGTMTEEQLEEATRAWAVGEIKAARAGKAHSDLVSGAPRRIAESAKK